MKADQKLLGENHPGFAIDVNNLAALYRLMGRYAEADPLYLQAMTIYRDVFGEEHPSFALSCNNLAILYKAMSHGDKAEPFYLRAIEISTAVLGNDHPHTGIFRSNYESFLQERRVAGGGV